MELNEAETILKNYNVYRKPEEQLIQFYEKIFCNDDSVKQFSKIRSGILRPQNILCLDSYFIKRHKNVLDELIQAASDYCSCYYDNKSLGCITCEDNLSSMYNQYNCLQGNSSTVKYNFRYTTCLCEYCSKRIYVKSYIIGLPPKYGNCQLILQQLKDHINIICYIDPHYMETSFVKYKNSYPWTSEDRPNYIGYFSDMIYNIITKLSIFVDYAQYARTPRHIHLSPKPLFDDKTEMRLKQLQECLIYHYAGKIWRGYDKPSYMPTKHLMNQYRELCKLFYDGTYTIKTARENNKDRLKFLYENPMLYHSFINLRKQHTDYIYNSFIDIFNYILITSLYNCKVIDDLYCYLIHVANGQTINWVTSPYINVNKWTLDDACKKDTAYNDILENLILNSKSEIASITDNVEINVRCENPTHFLDENDQNISLDDMNALSKILNNYGIKNEFIDEYVTRNKNQILSEILNGDRHCTYFSPKFDKFRQQFYTRYKDE